jgi:hypothetical protein
MVGMQNYNILAGIFFRPGGAGKLILKKWFKLSQAAFPGAFAVCGYVFCHKEERRPKGQNLRDSGI